MATNQHANKVIYGGEVIIDLTADTATASSVLVGSTFHDKSGAAVTGTCTYDSDEGRHRHGRRGAGWQDGARTRVSRHRHHEEQRQGHRHHRHS